MSRQALNGRQLTINCLESDRHGGRPLYEWLLAEALHRGIARGTIFKAFAGFGRRRRMHTQKLLDLSHDLPVRVVFIDTPASIDLFLQQIAEVIEPYTYVMQDVTYHPSAVTSD